MCKIYFILTVVWPQNSIECLYISAVKPFLILANGFYLRNISFHGHQSLILNDLNNAVAIDFDYQEQMIYWSEITNTMSKISRFNMTDKNVSVSI